MIIINLNCNRLKTQKRLIGFVPRTAIFGGTSILFGAFSLRGYPNSSLRLSTSTTIRLSSDEIALRHICPEKRTCKNLHFNVLRSFTFLLSFFLLAGTAAATSWYVRPTSTGSQTGADWNNAWTISSISWSSVKPGDTIWLAGGTYSGALNPSASGTASAPILVYRATANDSSATSSPGWSTSFDTQAVIQGGINFFGPLSYVNVSGRTPSGFYWSSGSGGGNGSFGANNGNINNITLAYVELDGSANTTGNSGPTYGVDWAPQSNTVTNCVIDHCYLHSMAETLRASNWTGVVVQYCKIGNTNNLGDHNDVIYSYPPSSNCIWRYNTIYQSPGDGMFFEFGGANNFYFYGNVYWNSTGTFIGFKPPGTYGPIFVYNNTFCAAPGATDGQLGGIQDPNSKAYNNLFLQVFDEFQYYSVGAVSDYEALNYTSMGGFSAIVNSTHSFTFTDSGVFVNEANGDFHVTAAGSAILSKGLPLASDGFLNKDMDGNTRGGSNGWTIGAYQYAGGSGAPPAPTNLHISSTPTP
jgi:hypothetical protein